MNYIELNLDNRRRMETTCQNLERFEWEDSSFINILKGELPRLRNSSNKSEIISLFYKLSQKYKEYDFFNTNSQEFISTLSHIIDEIRKIEPYWLGLNISSIEDAIKLHKFCLISGEGGIGKSYFIKCLEEELVNVEKKHLCLYGKFCKDISKIDFEEIISIAEKEEFIFAFDAINEIDEQSQIDLAEKIKEIKKIRGVRVIITYRSHTMDEFILQKYKELAESTYEFTGVSFESAVEWLQKTPIIDINEYLDVLYSNNPFLLSKLPFILSGKQQKNNVSRFTYIYEQYIKKSLDKQTWLLTKKIAKFLYENNRKYISKKEIANIIENPIDYISQMEQKGFLSGFLHDGIEYFTFVIDSLADYLIVRHMWNEIADKSIDDCVNIIKSKMEDFYGIGYETIILMLFDKFSPNYSVIKDILRQTDLLRYFDFDTIVKIHFDAENIPLFLQNFNTNETKDLIVNFAGYINKPFNCTNYLNLYYIDNSQKQTMELSRKLSGKHFLSGLKGRLKNILYYTCKCVCTEDRVKENFYTALWCCAACNADIRKLSIKLLFEIIQRNSQYIKVVIDIYDKVEDDYIREAIIFVLSSLEQNKDIKNLFNKLLKDYEFTFAKSLKRMSTYLKDDYGYINLQKNNLFFSDRKEISDDFISILHRIDLLGKDILPFRFWGVENFKSNVKFLSVDKNKIQQFNKILEQDFSCVKNGICNGNMAFHIDVEKRYGVSFSDKILDGKSLLSSLEDVFKEVFSKYGNLFEFEKHVEQVEDDFSSSIFKKCACISIDIFFGSLMCNYYLKDFGTYNNVQDSIGYEVYDPIAYDEDLNIRSPLSIFQTKIEKLCDIVVARMESPTERDEIWWRDLNITKRNLLGLLQPVKMDGHEWILLSGRISLRDPKDDFKWKDTYDLFVCSSNETLKGDGNDRYLTIEIDDYLGNLLEYKNCESRPHLCKNVPDIAYNSGIFEETQLVLPPAEIISILNLHLNLEEMCWYNEDDEKIIYCNNNKSSYYRDPIMGTVFVRKDAYERLKEVKSIKFFAFAEKYISGKGFCRETDFHFEIIDNVIVKEISNSNIESKPYGEKIPLECKKCKYDFYSKPDEKESQKSFWDLIKGYGG